MDRYMRDELPEKWTSLYSNISSCPELISELFQFLTLVHNTVLFVHIFRCQNLVLLAD